jgi:hypothetical protein
LTDEQASTLVGGGTLKSITCIDGANEGLPREDGTEPYIRNSKGNIAWSARGVLNGETVSVNQQFKTGSTIKLFEGDETEGSKNDDPIGEIKVPGGAATITKEKNNTIFQLNFV